MEDSFELRAQLVQAWRAVLASALERGSPPEAVIETMLRVALEYSADHYGASSAASYLHLLAEQLREAERSETSYLVQGEDAPRSGHPEPMRTDFVWPGRDALFD